MYPNMKYTMTDWKYMHVISETPGAGLKKMAGLEGWPN